MEDKDIKKLRKIFLSLLVVIILLPVLLYGLLHVNFVQQYLVNRITAYLSEELRTEVSVGSVDVYFFRSIILHDVRVLDPQQEVLIASDRLDMHLHSLSIPQKKIIFSEVHLYQPELALYKEAETDDHNFRFIINYLSGRDPVSDKDNWRLNAKALRITDATVDYRDENSVPVTHGFDYGHFRLEDLNLAINDIKLTDSVRSFRIDQFQYAEPAGFVLDQLAASITLVENNLIADDLRLEAGQSSIQADLELYIGEHSQNKHLADPGRGHLYLYPSSIDLADVGHYYKSLYGIQDILHVEGQIQAGERQIQALNIYLQHDKHTVFNGDVLLSRLGAGNGPHLDIRVEQLRSRISDIQHFRLPEAWKSRHVELPGYLEALGDIRFAGRFTGTPDDFLAEGIMHTSLGLLESEVYMTKEEPDGKLHYQGKLITESFDLGSLLGKKGFIGNMYMKAGIAGSGFAADGLRMQVDGDIDTLTMAGIAYSNIQLEGDFINQKFDGRLHVDDQKLHVDFNGLVDFDTVIPEFHFHMDIAHANLTNMGLFQRDDLYGSIIAAELDVNARAATMDDMQGELTIRDIRYAEIPLDPSVPDVFPATYRKDSIYINNTIWSQENRHLRIRSDFADVDIHGNMRFDKLRESLRIFVASYSPSMNLASLRDVQEPPYVQDIDFSIRLKDTRLLSELFMPGLEISAGSWINGSFRAEDAKLQLEGHADTLRLGGRTFHQYQLQGFNINNRYDLVMTSEKLMLSENRAIEHIAVFNAWQRDRIRTELIWGDSDAVHNKGRIKGLTHFYDEHRTTFSIPESEAHINGNTWRFNTDHKIILDTNRLEIHQLMAYHDDQFIKADGVLGPESGDHMELSFSNFDVGYSDVLLGEGNVSFGGMMDGYVSFTGLYQSPGVAADILVDDFSFNHVLMGDLVVISSWNEEKQAFEVQAEVYGHDQEEQNKPLIARGNLYTGNHGQNYDLDLDLSDFKMDVWGRYLQSFTEGFSGLATGELRMDGPFNRPQLSGHLELSDIVMPVPYLNTTYTFDHGATIEKDRFIFDQVMLNDTLGNNALVNGVVTHDYFRNFTIDFELRPDEMIIFNTTAADNDIFFGTAFFTGLGRIYGPANDITMDVNARTERGTRVMMPLNYTGDVRERHFISFVSPEEGSENDFISPRTGGNLTMNFDLEVTPDAEVELFFDAQFGDIIRGQGSGDLSLEIAPDGSFNIYGDYVIESGEYLFSLQNIINKRFRIDQGSNIRWTGDINDADVDLRAVYRLRTSLYELLSGGGADDETANQFRRRVPVETVLLLEDNLFNPNISFDIDVPGGDDNTRELIEREITTDQEMNRQVFSLLVLNRFMPRDQYAALGYGMGATSSELLSHQLSNWLSQISSDFDIGFNYRPGDEISSQEVELALSTQLFDDRVIIDGNFGVAGNQTATGHQTQGTNQIIGDVNVEVKITPEGKFRVKAFNRSNTFDIIHSNAPYTQGIGVFYRREFDQLYDFFRRQRVVDEMGPPDNAENDEPRPDEDIREEH